MASGSKRLAHKRTKCCLCGVDIQPNDKFAITKQGDMCIPCYDVKVAKRGA